MVAALVAHRQLPALERVRERDAPSITKLVARHLIQAVSVRVHPGVQERGKFFKREANGTFYDSKILRKQ